MAKDTSQKESWCLCLKFIENKELITSRNDAS